MADYSIFIPFIIFIVAGFIAFKILSGVIKLAVLIVSIVIALMAVFGFFVMIDAQQFVNGMENENSLFLFSDEGEAVVGLFVNKEDGPMLVSMEKLEEYTENLKDEDYAAMKGDYFKVIIIDSRVLEKNGTDEGANITEGIMEADGEKKIELFLEVLNGTFSDPIALLTEYKKGNIIVYEETLMFRTFKFLPASAINSFAEKFLKPLNLYEHVSLSESQIRSWMQQKDS